MLCTIGRSHAVEYTTLMASAAIERRVSLCAQGEVISESHVFVFCGKNILDMRTCISEPLRVLILHYSLILPYDLKLAFELSYLSATCRL